MPVGEEFASEVEALALTITGYQEGKSGQNGLCDCIGLIMGAMARLGRGSYPIHSTNYFARYQSGQLASLADAQQLQVGQIVYKSTQDTADLNARYQPGGRYYTGDMLDYYHVGVVTAVSPLEITHCTQTGSVNGIKRDSTIKGWDWFGAVDGVEYDDYTQEEGTTMQYQAVVHAADGSTVNLRPSPSTSKPYIARVPVGATVTVNESAQGWAQVEWDGKTGYMMSRFLTAAEPSEGDGETVMLTLPRSAAQALLDALEGVL